jgi:hypothetical protein
MNAKAGKSASVREGGSQEKIIGLDVPAETLE